MDLLAPLTKAIDDIVAAGPSAFGDGESVLALQHQWNRLGAFVISSIGEFDTWGEWGNDGAKNAAAWLSKKLNESTKESHRRVKYARLLRDLPIVAEAFSAGELNTSHLDLLLSVRNPRTKDTMTRDEALLVEQAQKLDFKDFAQVVSYWEQGADPDGVEEDAMAQRGRRDAYLEPTIDGMFFGKVTLDPVSGTIIYDELRRLEQELFEADWAEAKARLGREPKVSDLARTPGQRRADAFVEMAVRSRTAPAGGRRPAPLFSVLIDFPTLSGRICELASGLVVTPGTLLSWLDQAYVERAIFGLDGRIEVSETARFFTGATRRAMDLRDRRCTHPFCNEPVERCQGDHIKPASEGGPTNQENGRLLCAFHNRLRNQRPPPDE
jgi:Domain of unknown function (DUF222)/HNH endonuclease